MEVLGSGHVRVHGHALERSVSMDTKYICAPFSAPAGLCTKMCICPREGWVRMGDLSLWQTVLGRAQSLWLQLGKLLFHGGQCMEGQRVSWLICRWPQARGLNCSAGRRGLWAQPLPSFLGVVVPILELCHHCRRCPGAAAAPGSVGAGLSVLLISAELCGVATGNQFFALEAVFGWCLAFCAC